MPDNNNSDFIMATFSCVYTDTIINKQDIYRQLIFGFMSGQWDQVMTSVLFVTLMNPSWFATMSAAPWGVQAWMDGVVNGRKILLSGCTTLTRGGRHRSP